MKYRILAHPKTRKEKSWVINKVEKKLKELKLDYSIDIGTKDFSTRDIAANIKKQDCDAIICLGGDGTLHGILNGMYGKNIKLGVIPFGHGNDMARSLNIPRDIDEAIDVIAQGKTDEYFLGKIEQLNTGRTEMFFSVVGLGFDVRVIELVEEKDLKSKYGSFAYNIGTIKTIFSYKSPRISAKYNGNSLEVNVMMFSVGNSTTYGGGMKITPKANPQKDHFNITYLRQMSIPVFLWHFPKVFSGKHINVKKRVENFNANEIEIDEYPRGKIIADGEMLDMLPAKITKSKIKQKIIIP